MKTFKKISLALVPVLFVFFLSCKKTAIEPSVSSVETSAVSKASTKSNSNFGGYNINVGVSSDGATWTYTITKNAGAKNLSHLIIDLNNCADESATFSDIVSATVNGQPADLTPTEGSGTTCNPQALTSNFVKINFDAADSYVVVITFDRGYNVFETANAWIKAGTSCNIGTIKAPGCPIKIYCSYSQGYFFAKGVDKNGALAYWTNGLTIGGVNYTQLQAAHFWDVNTGKGSDQAMNAFFQLGAVRLSSAEPEVAADATIIDAYFSGMNLNTKIVNGAFVLPATNNGYTKAQVKAAGSNIGAYIEAHHCQ